MSCSDPGGAPKAAGTRDDVDPGCDSHILVAVDRVGDRRGADAIVRLEVPQRLPGNSIQRGEGSLVVAAEDQARGGRDQSGAVGLGVDLHVLPLALAGRQVKSTDVHLPGLFGALDIAGRLEVEAARPKLLAALVADAATFLGGQIEQPRGRVVCRGHPVRRPRRRGADEVPCQCRLHARDADGAALRRQSGRPVQLDR